MQWLKWGMSFMFLVALAAYVLISLRVGVSVHAISALATREHPGDRVEALIQYVEDPRHSLRDRNRAVWALGQLGDRRALPVLHRHYTGGPCDHDAVLCQRELSKAIELADGGMNISALVWRHSNANQGNGAAEAAGQSLL